jgi:hypothetical protein
MRTPLILVLLATASASQAQGTIDRYGYGRAPQPSAQQTALGQEQRFLSWSNKSDPSQSARSDNTQMEQASTYQRFEPQTPYQQPSQRYAALENVPMRSAPGARNDVRPSQDFEPRFNSIEPERALSQPAPRLAPQQAYIATPQPEPVRQIEPPTRVELAGGPPSPQRVAAPLAQAATPPGGQARYYSLHREYGLAPDAIPEQQLGNNYVLIGPSANRDPDASDEKAEKPF